MAFRGEPSSATALSRLGKGRIALRSRRRRLAIPRGQSLVEFALILPAMLFLSLIALDFGRVYLGWINLQNMTRAASNFAANNSEAWLIPNDPNYTATITEYRNQVLNDAAKTNCVLTPTVPADPTFADGNGDGTKTEIGDRATVSLTCTFTLITPIISNIVGKSLLVSASAVFPVKSGQFATSGGTGPTADFTASPTTTTTGTNIAFTDASTGSPTTWAWTFGDGAASSSQNPTHAYSAAGQYTVALTATNASGSNTMTKTNYITISAPVPIANFTGTPTSITVGSSVSFTDTSTGSPTTWAWTFGDGGTSNSGPNVAHAYNTAGTYSVSLTVTGPGGTNSITKTNYITVSVATCTVPDFVGLGTKINSAAGIWSGAGFTSTITEQAGHSGGNYKITFQSIVGGNHVACSSAITVNG